MKNRGSVPYLLISLVVVVGAVIAWKAYSEDLIIKESSSLHRSQGTHSKYARAVIQPVTFYAQCSSMSNKMIARKGIIFKKPGARATVMLCHGFMCNKTDIRFLRMLFQDYNVMIFDFRAHGEAKDGQLCTFGHDELHDIIAAARLIKSDPELGKMPLIAYGFSMGAVSAINAQAYDTTLFDCAILDCPFDSTDAVLDRSIERLQMTVGGYTMGLPGRWLLKKYAYNYYVQSLLKFLLRTMANIDAGQVQTYMLPIDTVQAISKVTIPTLFIVCRNDEKAPPYAVRKVYEQAKGYKRLWITNGRFHCDSFFYNPEKYAHRVRRFLEKYLDGKFTIKAQEKIYQDDPEV